MTVFSGNGAPITELHVHLCGNSQSSVPVGNVRDPINLQRRVMFYFVTAFNLATMWGQRHNFTRITKKKHEMNYWMNYFLVYLSCTSHNDLKILGNTEGNSFKFALYMHLYFGITARIISTRTVVIGHTNDKEFTISYNMKPHTR